MKGKSDGTEAKKDQELVLYEFMNMLVRIAFQRANPTFGNFGDKKSIKHLPGCLRVMIEDEILPRARKDTSAVFRETVMTELSVLKVVGCRPVYSNSHTYTRARGATSHAGCVACVEFLLRQ